jgi:pantetheine-phosphate adenylyltransferase
MVEAECAAITAKTGGEIVVHPFENLLIDCARDVGAEIIIRGLRAVADFEYEFQMVGMNRALDSSIETVFLMADARRQAIASKLVKEIARLGATSQSSSRPRWSARWPANTPDMQKGPEGPCISPGAGCCAQAALP